MTAPGDIQAKLRCLTSEAPVEQLIPGIPDEITMDQISTKLPWKSVVVLSAVSRGWRQAVQSRQVYNARVRCHSTQSFTVISGHPAKNVHAISLWDSSHVVVKLPPITSSVVKYKLPPIRSEYFDEVTPSWGRCATLDGKAYVLGGLDCKVHVLDVAGQRRWTQCANMLKPRQEFGCFVIDAKIYVFGGAVNHESMQGSYLYNSVKDTRSKFRPIVSLKCGRHVPTLNPELAKYHSKFLYPYSAAPVLQGPSSDADLMEVFDPIKDEWRLVEPVGKLNERMFIAGGRFYSMNPLSIHVYDFYGNSWAPLHSFSFPGTTLSESDSAELWPVGILTDDNELLAMVEWPNGAAGERIGELVQSRGLGSQNKELEWITPQVTFAYLSYLGRLVHEMAKDDIQL